ncbi:GAF and ANTAR domain-containing protein [Streptomyces winkii]|uniref:GAF and ANTAR domain-containing protein n=1 Tax=Streptomyces winkii TaxID=3051178 RepID=UPI0028D7EF65|nr:GAF and ANTAR domain-containing protein [Streptomyces sp. DSM 40971]
MDIGGERGGLDPDEPDERLDPPDEQDIRWDGFVAEMTAEAPSELALGVPRQLCEACVRLLPVTGGSLSLADGAGRTRVTLCATDEVAARLAEIQYTLGEGPCRYASEMRAPVSAVDLTGGRDARRWPVFAHQAVEAGAGSAFSFPMSQSGSVLGTVDLYNTGPSSLGEADIRLGLRAADAVAMVLAAVHHGQGDETQPGVGWWTQAEANHEEVYQATGMLMVRLGVSADEAMARLRARAFVLNRTITDVAKDVTNRRDDPRSGD